MEVRPTKLPGVCTLELFRASDARGSFTKTFSAQAFAAQALRTDFRETYYSLSGPRVLRGLHFQLPPAQHAKVVTCLAGRVLDVVVDLRTDSPTFRQHELFELSAARPQGLYLPAGVAHGFYVLEAPALLWYSVTSEYAAAQDAGIRWDSAGIPWPDQAPVLSARDRGFPALADFASPFTMADAR